MADARTDTVTAPPPRRRLLRILGVLGVLVVGLLLFLHTSPARRFVLSRVTEVLQQQNVEFNTDELRYNLLDLSLGLGNVKIRSQAAPDLPPFATVERLNLDLSLTQLVRRRYVLQGGTAHGVAVHYFVDSAGRDNVPRPPRDPNQPSQPLDYLIEDLQVTDARVRYENRAQRIDFSLPVSAMSVTGHALSDRHTVNIKAAGGALTMQDRKAALDQLDAQLDLGDNDARIERLDLTAEGARLAVSGSVGQFEDPHADLKLQETIDAARASSVAGLKERVGGTFEVTANARGRIAAPVVEGNIKGTDISFRDFTNLQMATAAGYGAGPPARWRASGT